MYGGSGANFNVPNYYGLFLRMVANGDVTDPDRDARTDRGDGTTGDAVGTKQTWQNESHEHEETAEEAGSHNHAVLPGGKGLVVLTTDAGSRTYNSNTGNNYTNLYNTENAGGHTHPVVAAPSGGNQSNPINAYVDYYIVGDIQP